MRTTGPLLAIGGITFVNKTVLNNQPVDWRIPVATGLAIGAFALLEHAAPELAVGVTWIALVTVLLSRVDKNTPAPVESILEWTR